MPDLLALYLETLERCAPDVLVREKADASMPRDVVAIGKCAGPLLDGIADVLPVESAFAAIPAGYRAPRTRAAVHYGGHPLMTEASFAAGRALLEFIDAHDDLLVLVSGGGSACVEVALAPFTEEEVARRNAALVASSLPISGINAARSAVSAIKGGRLRERIRGRCVTLVYSDVATGALQDVASGPTIVRAEDAVLVADNGTLTRTASELAGAGAVLFPAQIEGGVEEAAQRIARAALELRPGQVLVCGGEPTVAVRGKGKGGRCSELAVRFQLAWRALGGGAVDALFGSSDGVDGNSGSAGIELRLPAQTAEIAEEALRSLDGSDSFSYASRIGLPIMIPPTGNNLRDLYLVARD